MLLFAISLDANLFLTVGVSSGSNQSCPLIIILPLQFSASKLRVL